MKKVLFRFLILFVLIFTGASIVYITLYSTPPLPIYNPSDLNPQVVDKEMRSKDKNHTIGDFLLTDQLNNSVTPGEFTDKIYVASFIFTTCEGICPAMTGNLKSVYTEFLDDDEIKLLSHSVTPEIDSVPALKAYADKYGVKNHNKWYFTTAPRKHIYELARMHYFAATTLEMVVQMILFTLRMLY